MEIIKGPAGVTAVKFKGSELYNDELSNLAKKFHPTPMQIVESDMAWAEEKKNLARQIYAEIFPVIAKHNPRSAAEIAAEITESTIAKVNGAVSSFALCKQTVGNGK